MNGFDKIFNQSTELLEYMCIVNSILYNTENISFTSLITEGVIGKMDCKSNW